MSAWNKPRTMVCFLLKQTTPYLGSHERNGIRFDLYVPSDNAETFFWS